MSHDLSAPVRAALVGAGVVTAALSAYLGSYPVFTRVPVPDDAPYPMIVVHAQFGAGDEDGVDDLRPIAVRDVTVYGRNDTAEHYRAVESLAYAVWELFHRQRASLSVPGWSVVDVRAQQPRPAPVDDEEIIARRVELTVRLARAA